jgi:hypothetical protein
MGVKGRDGPLARGRNKQELELRWTLVILLNVLYLSPPNRESQNGVGSKVHDDQKEADIETRRRVTEQGK